VSIFYNCAAIIQQLVTNLHLFRWKCCVSPNCLLLFKFIFLFVWCRFEEYDNPRTVLFVTLTKTFVMEAVNIGIIVGFWITFRYTSEVGPL
jgi:hypothetical protein